MADMSSQGMTEATAVELLAAMRDQEARRQRRNRILVWVAIAAVIVGGIVAAVVKHQQDEARDDRIANQMFCDMAYTYGTDAYYDCVVG